jgi:hypothetical protein
MSIINLQALNNYSQVQNKMQTNNAQTTKDAASFQDTLVATSLAQSASHLKLASAAYTSQVSGSSSGVLGALKETLRKQEVTSLKSMVDEASALDVAIAATESKNMLDILVKIRNEMQQALDKIMNISI